MDEHTYDNWVKVKQTFEASGNTDNFFYTRACAIVGGRPDPLDLKMENKIHGPQDDRTET